MSIRRAQDERIEGTPDGLNAVTEIVDVPDTPTAISASNVGTSRAYNNGAATVTITANTTGGTPSSYTVTSTPGSYTGSGTSPVTVTGLQSATSYTFTAVATNSTGTSGATSASSSITATTVPQAPTIGTVSVTNATTVSVPFTAGATGGSAITSYVVSSSPSIALTTTGTTSPLTVTGSFAASTGYTFTMTAVNANGTSTASSASNSVTPLSYTLGGVGEGGGIIFYDAGSTLSWGRYLEAATTSTSPAWASPDISRPFCAVDGVIGLTNTAIGAGKANTNAIIAFNNTSTNAAVTARAFTGGGYSGSTTGWYLGSVGEMQTLANRKENVGGFAGVDYQTSNEALNGLGDPVAIDNRVVNFSDSFRGYVSNTDKQNSFRVRPIRSF